MLLGQEVDLGILSQSLLIQGSNQILLRSDISDLRSSQSLLIQGSNQIGLGPTCSRFPMSQSLLIQGSNQMNTLAQLVPQGASQSLLIQGSNQMAAAFFILKQQHVAAPNSNILDFILTSLDHLM